MINVDTFLNKILKNVIGKISFEEFIIISFYILLEQKNLIEGNEDVLSNIISYKDNFITKRQSEFDYLKQEYVDVDVDVDVVDKILELNPTNSNSFSAVFYTPPFISTLLKEIAYSQKDKYESVYDPTCGGGALLEPFDKDMIHNGQELEFLSSNICIARLLLKGVKKDKIRIKNDDTILVDCFSEDKFDLVVSNPPFGVSYKADKALLSDPRYSECGVLAPPSTADYNFILNNIYHLNDKGMNLNICSPGLLYRGNAEKKIRQYLINKNFVDCVIMLPNNCFTYTSIATSILILKKDKKDTNILFIDASNEFVAEGKKNILSSDNIKNIVELYKNRTDVLDKCSNTTLEKVIKNDYALSPNQYIKSSYVKEEIDIVAIEKQLVEIRKRYNKQCEELDKLTKTINLNLDNLFEANNFKFEDEITIKQGTLFD